MRGTAPCPGSRGTTGRLQDLTAQDYRCITAVGVTRLGSALLDGVWPGPAEMTDRHDSATFGQHSVLPGPEPRPSPGSPARWPRSCVEKTMSRGRSLFIAARAAGLLMVTFAVAGLIF